ncbi:alpha/beta fold hydrolase [uncultured Draconibacterium sp.]|uniref:alpha/beta hydrolase n=1 Tax=uncultured Draconibacterium sp. TaxID=1573823 RepID=UPI0029C95CD6|nr:alpha/beta fold hydrolase [uncultured Draconibacterium sp.]
MKNALYYISLFFVVFHTNVMAQKPSYHDITYYSKVFGGEKTFRIYLPQKYDSTTKRYPVIYFFHGWGGRYFKDPSANIAHEKLGKLAEKHQVILVMWDGNMEETEPRPYNVGNHADMKYKIQMKDYFPELISHIDSSFPTIPDRNNRGIIGFSMGGFMASYLAGKYPDKVSAVVSFTGSAEFFVGYPDNYTLYPVRYTLDNLRDLAFYLHNRDNCPMAGLNEEVYQAAVWNEMDNFQYQKVPGEHSIDKPGETEVFESAISYLVEQFNKPKPTKPKWSHYDLYPEFKVWDYTVQSNKSEPGFLYLRNVSKSGFGFYTYRWLPHGSAIKNCKAAIITAPCYKPNFQYQITIVHSNTGVIKRLLQESDKVGRLHFSLPGDGCEVGIEEASANPAFSIVGYRLNGNEKYLKINEQNELRVQLLNRTQYIPANKKIKIELSCSDSTVRVLNPVDEIELGKESIILASNTFKVICTKKPPSNGSPARLNMKIKISFEDSSNEDSFTLPVWFDVPYFEKTLIITERNDTVSKNKIISPGNRIKMQQDGHLLKLYTEDPFVDFNEEKVFAEVIPAYWPDGLSLSSQVKIAEDCPNGHEIEFLAYYETKTYNPIFRQRHWGKVKIVVKE